MTHEMKLKVIYFDKIKSGEKIYEVRLNDEKRKLINVGDFILFKREPELREEIKAQVKDLIYFKSFNELVGSLPLSKVGFDKYIKSAVVDIYRQFYNEQDENKYGVVAIKIEIKNN